MRVRRIPLLILVLAMIGLVSVITWYYNADNEVAGFYGSVLKTEAGTEQELQLYVLANLMNRKVIVRSDDSIGLDNAEALANNLAFEPIIILRTQENANAGVDTFTIRRTQLDSIYRLVLTRLPNDNIRSLAMLVNKRLELFEMEKGTFKNAERKRKKTIYVKPGGTGNGNSWAKAMGDVQNALKAAKRGDEIWVAAGKYATTKTTDRTLAFNIPDGVKLYGGFAGNEKERYARDWQKHVTMLSGEIGSVAPDDNAYTVVLTKNVSAETLVDGFTITGGMANGRSAKGNPDRSGGAWYNDGSGGVSNPTIVNCTFVKNYARDGGGLYNYAQNGIANPIIQHCSFLYNRADLDGGAVLNNGSGGIANPIIESCVFQENEATYGGGICNTATAGEAKPVIADCSFIGNVAYIRGSSIYNAKDAQGITEAIVQNCRFEQNAATVGETAEREKPVSKK
ncbi:MAG: hypothetical protein ACK4TA_24250, partial [Saprospiraceae bacterium]